MHGSNKALHKSPDIQMGGGGFYEARAGRDFPPHSHLNWELVYYQSGFVTCIHGNESFSAEPGLLWLTPPGVTHAERAVTAYRNIYFELIAPHSHPWPMRTLDDQRQNIGRLCTELVLEYSCRRDSSLVPLLIQQLLIHIARSTDRSEQRSSLRIVRRAEIIMASSLNTRPKIAQIARDLAISESGLRSAFQRERGKSPLEVLQQIRRDRALGLLRNSRHKLDLLARLCGYDSPSHLTRDIKRTFGHPPGRFRQ